MIEHLPGMLEIRSAMPNTTGEKKRSSQENGHTLVFITAQCTKALGALVIGNMPNLSNQVLLSLSNQLFFNLFEF